MPLTRMSISNDGVEPKEVAIEPSGRLLTIPPDGWLVITLERDEDDIEINLADSFTTLVLFEVDGAAVFTREEWLASRKANLR